MESNWNVIYVKSRQEKKVASQLQKHNIEFYLPLIQTIRIWSDRKKKVEIPLFNGYIFVQPKKVQRDSILTLPGIVKYLRYNGNDACVSKKELDLIRSLISKGYEISDAGDNVTFTAGEKVKIISGPLKEYEGEVIRIGDSNYAVIVFDNSGQTVKVKLPKQILKKIDV